MNVLNQLFGSSLPNFLEGLLIHVATDQLQPVIRKQLHKNTSDAERAKLIAHARAFADAYEKRQDDTAATELASIFGDFHQ